MYHIHIYNIYITSKAPFVAINILYDLFVNVRFMCYRRIHGFYDLVINQIADSIIPTLFLHHPHLLSMSPCVSVSV